VHGSDVSLDQPTASLDNAHREQVEAQHISTAPAAIMFSTTPATLIFVNGPPAPAVEARRMFTRGDTPFILLLRSTGRR